jgi:hypothetical protein
MNTTRTTLPVAIFVPLTAVLAAVLAFQVLGPAQATETPRPRPGVSPVATGTDLGVGPAPVNRYAGKEQELLKHLSGDPRFAGGAADETKGVAVTNGVPRDQHGGAYLGKQQEILRHL